MSELTDEQRAMEGVKMALAERKKMWVEISPGMTAQELDDFLARENGRQAQVPPIGAEAPANLIHVLLDNGVHDSTGGQATVSAIIDFADAALACNYRNAYMTDDVAGFAKAFSTALDSPGPHLIHARIAPGSLSNLGRPTVKPDQVARRFRSFLSGNASRLTSQGVF